MSDRKEALPDEYKPSSQSPKALPLVAAAQKTLSPATLGAGQMAPAVATENKATFTEMPVSRRN